MSVTWHNKYDDLPTCINGQCDPGLAAGYARAYRLLKHTRVEMRIDGYWLCPCVGMRADQTSHVWSFDYDADFDENNLLPSKLRPRHPKQVTRFEHQESKS